MMRYQSKLRPNSPASPRLTGGGLKYCKHVERVKGILQIIMNSDIMENKEFAGICKPSNSQVFSYFCIIFVLEQWSIDKISNAKDRNIVKLIKVRGKRAELVDIRNVSRWE